ncbi:MAG: hypothetical protein V3R71_01615 [Gemmatimonadales bacterium]
MDRIDTFTPTPDDVPDPEHLRIPTPETVERLRRANAQPPLAERVCVVLNAITRAGRCVICHEDKPLMHKDGCVLGQWVRELNVEHARKWGKVRFDLERETQADGAFVIPGKGL